MRAAAGIACLLGAGALFAITMRAPEPDPWFFLTIQVEKKSLPSGVELQRARYPHGDFAYFTNSSSTPLYIVMRPAGPANWLRDLPPNVIPDKMALAGKMYQFERGLGLVEDHWDGILVENFLRFEKVERNGRVEVADSGTFEMPAYLGKQPIVLRGWYIRARQKSGERALPRLELDAPLPAGLRVTGTRTDAGRFAIANDGDVPLYTVVTFQRPVGWVTEVPAGFLATHKVVDGRHYLAHHYNSNQPADAWREESPAVAALSERTLPMYVPGLELKQRVEDNRPAAVAVPKPQPFEMVVFYGTQQLTIRGRVVYDLNPAYDPLASKGPAVCMSCTGSMCDECMKHQRARQSVALPDRPTMY